MNKVYVAIKRMGGNDDIVLGVAKSAVEADMLWHGYNIDIIEAEIK